MAQRTETRDPPSVGPRSPPQIPPCGGFRLCGPNRDLECSRIDARSARVQSPRSDPPEIRDAIHRGPCTPPTTLQDLEAGNQAHHQVRQAIASPGQVRFPSMSSYVLLINLGRRCAPACRRAATQPLRRPSRAGLTTVHLYSARSQEGKRYRRPGTHPRMDNSPDHTSSVWTALRVRELTTLRLTPSVWTKQSFDHTAVALLR